MSRAETPKVHRLQKTEPRLGSGLPRSLLRSHGDYTPTAMKPRRKTTQVVVGDDRVGRVAIGGDATISVQTMTAGYTYEIDACVTEINKLAAAGADIVRVAVPTRADTEALGEILNQTRVPIVADVHFHFQRAIEAVDAGVHKIRLNPGNINDRDQVNAVIDACKERGLPIRIG